MITDCLYPDWKLKTIMVHLWLKQSANKSRWEAGRRERVKADPVRLAMKMESQRRNARKRRDRINSDPALRKEYLSKVSARSRKNYALKKATDPLFAAKHRARISAYNKTEKGRFIQNELQKRRRRESIPFRMAHYCRKRIADALSGRKKSSKTTDLLGCSIEHLKHHLESQFQPGMSWYNWGNRVGCWTMDHKIPCASFDLSDPEQKKKCFHFSNLQPLWHNENCAKNSIVNGSKKYYRDHMPAQSISA